MSPPCAAQSDAETEIARERFKEGVSHYDNQQYDKARMAFLQAYALKPHSAVLLNLAQSELRAGRFAEAAANFDQYIRENPSAPAMTHAREALAEARLKVAEVNIGVSTPEATIMLDGAELGQSPLPRPIFVMPGSHVVSARIGSNSAEQVLQANPGQQLYLTLELAAPSPLRITAAPGGAAAEVTGNRQKFSLPLAMNPKPAADPNPGFLAWLGQSPGAVAAVTLGVFGLTSSAVLGGFANSAYASAQSVKDDIKSRLRIDSSNSLLMVGITACGDAANGRGYDDDVGEIVREERSKQYATACALFSSNSDSGDRLKTLAFVGLGVGAAASLGTIVWYLTRGSQTVPTERPVDTSDRPFLMRASVTPILSSETQGLSIALRF